MDVTSFSSYFTDRILDNNGISVTDINIGLKNIYDNIINVSDTSNYSLVVLNEENESMPDEIAHNYFGDQNMWFYFLFTNALDDPFKELKSGWAFAIVDPTNAKLATDTSEYSNLNNAESRIGKVITLN